MHEEIIVVIGLFAIMLLLLSAKILQEKLINALGYEYVED